jgi:transketolase
MKTNVEKESTRKAFGQILVEIGKKNSNLIVMSADLMHSTGTEEFKKMFPDRFFNFGLAEQNMFGAAAGLASCGKNSIITTFATFATMRACEQLRTDIAYPKMKAIIVGTHGGISMGAGGTTHHATEDIAIVRSIANMTIVVPADAIEVKKLIPEAIYYNGPIYIRLGRDPEPIIHTDDSFPFKIGEAMTMKEGNDVTIIAFGRMVYEGLIAAEKLDKQGISTAVINMHTIKPLDAKAVIEAGLKSKLVVTIEEHNILGGLGSAVSEVLAEKNVCPVKRIGLKDIFSAIGDYEGLLKKYMLTGKQIAEQIKAWL